MSAGIFASLTTWMTSDLTADISRHRGLNVGCSIVSLALSYCDDIARNFWINKTLPDPPQNVPEFNGGMTASLPTSPLFCRNRKLAEVIEELSQNITLSLLGAATIYNTSANVVSTTTRLVYVYRPYYLIITYATAGLVALVAIMFGMAALHENEVAHSRDLPAILNATRNPELKFVSKDSGLSALPLDKTAARTRLSFRLLQNVDEADSHRMGFEFASD